MAGPLIDVIQMAPMLKRHILAVFVVLFSFFFSYCFTGSLVSWIFRVLGTTHSELNQIRQVYVICACLLIAVPIYLMAIGILAIGKYSERWLICFVKMIELVIGWLSIYLGYALAFYNARIAIIVTVGVTVGWVLTLFERNKSKGAK